MRLAAERHLRDLERAAREPEWGFYFDEAAAQWAIDFFPQLLKHYKGEWAGKPIVLEPWQEFIVGSLWGWRRHSDGTRRFRVAYVEVPRKNGKSTLAAGIGILLAFFDDEPGAEVYAAATKRDQAKIVWGDAKQMVLASPNIRRRVNILALNLHDPLTSSKFEPLSADYDSMDGLNISGAIVDELHAHKTRGMWDVIETATGARREPLTLAITTAGFERQSVCYEQHDYGTKILERVFDDETFFVYIASIDENDDWTDPRAWAKANPNLGVSVKLDDLERKCEKAKQVLSEQNAFLRLHLDVWTEQESRWLSVEKWDENEPVAANEAVALRERRIEELRGRVCFGAIDLSSTTDLTSALLWFPDPDDEGGIALLWNWVPAENVQQRVRRDRVPYDLWIRQGFVTATEGNVVDYDAVRTFFRDFAGLRYEVKEIAIDRWNSTQLQTQLMADGFTVVPVGQGFASMTAPTKEVEKLVLSLKVRHGGDPVLRWAASNVVVETDAAGNLKPSKAKATERIDPMVTLIMVVGRAMVNPNPESVYDREDRGFLTF